MAIAHLEEFSGYVTTFSTIAGRTHEQLEALLGFSVGTLSSGMKVYQLRDAVGPNDFVWKDRTCYSDGWHFDPSVGEYVQRADELRAHLGKQLDYNEAAVDAELAAFQAAQVGKLNVRAGPGRIVKVVPNNKPIAYPDAFSRSSPQWRLTSRKKFIFIGAAV